MRYDTLRKEVEFYRKGLYSASEFWRNTLQKGFPKKEISKALGIMFRGELHDINALHREQSKYTPEYPFGNSIEPYDIWRENKDL